MSFIVKGIDLPETKDDRYIIQVYKSGDVYIGKETWDDTRKGRDKIINTYLGKFQAVQIPKGHGDIKDINMLELEKEVELADDWKTAHEIANCVKYAPTILEAEE